MSGSKKIMAAEKEELKRAGFTCEEEWLEEMSTLNGRLLPLAFAYCGMGHYAGVVRDIGQEPTVSERRYQVVHMGGSNGWEREDRYKEYRELQPRGKYTLTELALKMAKCNYAEDCLDLLDDMQAQ